MLNATQRQSKTIQALIKRIVVRGDNMHEILEERDSSRKWEIIEGIGLLLKIKTKDKNPPCIIKFTNERETKNHAFKVFYSFDVREPNETTAESSQINVSFGSRPPLDPL